MIGDRTTLLPKHSIPTSFPPKIVDIGCGSGFATLDLARHYSPDAQIYGLDLSAIPEAARSRAPSNLTWLRGNFLEDLEMTDEGGHRVFENNTFSHIFARALVYGIDNWHKFYAKTYDLLAPGGWIEHHDLDMEWYQLDPSSPTGRRSVDSSWGWPPAHRDACHAKGLDLYCGSNSAAYMQKAGFVDIQEKEFIWAYSPVEGMPELDMMVEHNRRTMKGAVGKICADVLPGWGWSEERIQRECLDRMENDWFGTPGIFFRYFALLARKPLDGEVVNGAV